MTWQELAKFNWQTDVPREINEHLAKDVGCTRKTRDGKNYIFTSEDDPGIIYIPKKQQADHGPAGSSGSRSEHVVARKARGTEANQSDTRNVLNQTTRLYVNAGAWGDRGHSDFVLVCGREVAVCSWLGVLPSAAEVKKRSGRTFADRQTKEPSSEKIKSFLNEACDKNKEVRDGDGNKTRAKLLRCYQAPKMSPDDPAADFVAEDELLVFLGDMHIHLFREYPCDNFLILRDHLKKVKGWNPYSSRLDKQTSFSMAPFLAEFLDYAKAKNARVAQLGDLYEVWEVQGLFDLLYGSILTLNAHPKEYYDKEFERDASRKDPRGERPPKPPYSVQIANPTRHAEWQKSLEDAKTKHCGIHWGIALKKYLQSVDKIDLDKPKDWRDKASLRNLLELGPAFLWGLRHPEDSTATGRGRGASPSPPRRSSRIKGNLQQGFGFTDISTVKERIKEQYDELKSHWAVLESDSCVFGNHDNIEDNPYWDHRYGGKAGTKPKDNKSDWQAFKDFIKRESDWVEHDDDEADLTEMKDKGYTREAGTGDVPCVCYEHGHAFDTYNNNKNFFRFDQWFHTDGGLLKTFLWVSGELGEPNFLSGKMRKWVDEIATKSLMGYATERAARIFQKHLRKRLLVFGHSHILEMWDYQEYLRAEAEAKAKAKAEAEARARAEQAAQAAQ